jgi:hypothetical protein
MSSRKATGTRFKDSEQRKAARSRQNAQLWRLVRTAVRLVDASRPMGKGEYEIPPEAMISLKHRCDELRFELKMHDLELLQEGENDE